MLIRSSFLSKPYLGFGVAEGMLKAAEKYHVLDPYSPKGERFGENHRATREHVIPKAAGGIDDESNIIPANARINGKVGCEDKSIAYKSRPFIVKQMPIMLEEMAQIKEPDFDGSTWAPKAKSTVYKVAPNLFPQWQSIG